MDRDDITGRLGEVRCPALIVGGSDDAPGQGRGDTRRLASPATFTVIGGAPHASNRTHSGAVNVAIVNFLRRLAR